MNNISKDYSHKSYSRYRSFLVLPVPYAHIISIILRSYLATSALPSPPVTSGLATRILRRKSAIS